MNSNIICLHPVYECRAYLNESSRPASFHRWNMKVVNKHIFLYLSAAPQHAVADNSEMFLRLERVMIKTIDVVSAIPTPLTLQEKKQWRYHHAIRVFRHQSGYTTDSVLRLIGRSSFFWKPFVPFKLSVYVQRYVQHMKHVKYPITRWTLSFVDWMCTIGSSDNIPG